MKTDRHSGKKMVFCSPGIIGAFLVGVLAAMGVFSVDGLAQDPQAQRIILMEAVVCEDVRELRPVNPAIVFPIGTGSIACFTRFDVLSGETFIRHRWYRRDELVTEQQLVLKSPQWSTFSRIQLREFDKGPWRIEIVDSDNRVLTILRFSVTE